MFMTHEWVPSQCLGTRTPDYAKARPLLKQRSVTVAYVTLRNLRKAFVNASQKLWPYASFFMGFLRFFGQKKLRKREASATLSQTRFA